MDFLDQGPLGARPGLTQPSSPTGFQHVPKPQFSHAELLIFWDLNPKVLAKVLSQKNFSFHAKVIS